MKISILITEAMDEIAPEKEIKIKNRPDPWINNEILHQIENRDKSDTNQSRYFKHSYTSRTTPNESSHGNIYLK